MTKRSKKSRPAGRTETKQETQPQAASKAAAPVAREAWTAGAATASPFASMRRFAEQMDRLFEDFRLGAPTLFPRLDLPAVESVAGREAWAPTVEVAERGGKLVVRADLPGLTKDDVKVELREDALCIRGERREEREEKRKGFFRSERTYGSFYREIALPEGIDTEQAKATFKNGVLEVTMPAPPKPAKGRRVPIDES